MTHILKVSVRDPQIHIKAYGGVVIRGVEQTEVQCEIDAPQLATLVEDNGHVYITANSSCELDVPIDASINIEKGMGSVSISNLRNKINIEKVLGNLILMDVNSAYIEKVGGNFSVRNASGCVDLEKVNANLVVENVDSFHCEKVGGNATVKNVASEFYLIKAAGNFYAENVKTTLQFERANGSIVARSVKLKGDVRAGGDIRLIDFDFDEELDLRAGGEIRLQVPQDFPGANLVFNSGANEITVKALGVDMTINDEVLEYQLGKSQRELTASAGSTISIEEGYDAGEEIIGDLSAHFEYEETAFSEMVQERAESATRRAEAKIRIAEKRLEQIQDQVEKARGIHLNLGIGDRSISIEKPIPPVPPVPPVTRPVGKKGASDEERLMILKMLQEKKITVDEAESLFRALED